MANSNEWIRNNAVITVLGFLVVGFSTGLATYQGILHVAKLDCIPQGTWVDANEVVGRVIGNSAVIQLDVLIEKGETIKDEREVESWLLEAVTFVHGLNLEHDDKYKETEMSTDEKNIYWAFDHPELETQRRKTLGVLRGLKASFLAKIKG